LQSSHYSFLTRKYSGRRFCKWEVLILVVVCAEIPIFTVGSDALVAPLTENVTNSVLSFCPCVYGAKACRGRRLKLSFIHQLSLELIADSVRPLAYMGQKCAEVGDYSVQLTNSVVTNWLRTQSVSVRTRAAPQKRCRFRYIMLLRETPTYRGFPLAAERRQFTFPSASKDKDGGLRGVSTSADVDQRLCLWNL